VPTVPGGNCGEEVIVTGVRIVNIAGLETAPSGLTTVTLALPGDVIRLAGT
jgi:hypothetical protein